MCEIFKEAWARVQDVAQQAQIEIAVKLQVCVKGGVMRGAWGWRPGIEVCQQICSRVSARVSASCGGLRAVKVTSFPPPSLDNHRR